MIILITGVPGSGKTLKAVEMILAWKAQGRAVYADIDGLNIPGVEQSPDDWRNTPEGSVVVYDECQKIFPSTGKAGVADDLRIRAMETHRHTGHDLLFITQAPTFLHAHIRKLVGKHYHVYRAMGMKAATVYAWDYCSPNVMDKKEQMKADVQRWSYPAKLFDYYTSATVHTHKFQMPKKLVLVVAAAAIIFGISAYFFSNSFLAKTIESENLEQVGSLTAEGPQSAAPAQASTYFDASLKSLHERSSATVSISGCVSGVHCRCFDQDGALIDLEPKMCRDYAAGFLALPIRINAGEGTRRDDKPKLPAPVQASTPSNWLSGANSPPSQIGHPDQGKVW